MKVLPGSFADDSDRLRRFVQEARAASAPNHAFRQLPRNNLAEDLASRNHLFAWHVPSKYRDPVRTERRRES